MAGHQRGNILLVTLDQWRADCLGVLGHPCLETPHLDALAAAGTLFRRHYAQAAPCGPSRASLLTGLYMHNHRSVRNGTPLDRRHGNLALELRAAGYDPALFGYTDTSIDPRGRPPGDPAFQTYSGILPGFTAVLPVDEEFAPWLAHLAARGHAVPLPPQPAMDIFLPAPRGSADAGWGPSFAPARYAAGDSDTSFLTDAVMRHVAAQGAAPWFVHLSYFRPHPPFIAPAPYHAFYDPAAVPPQRRQPDRAAEGAQHPWLAEQLRQLWSGPAKWVQEPMPMAAFGEREEMQLRATYYGMIGELDDALGRLFAMLKESGAWDKTLVIVTADHGEQLGDHWLYGKDGYFEATYHIPLVIRDPDAPAAARGRIVDAFTEAVDVMPTVLDWAGRPVPHQCDGRSLRPWLHGATPDEWRQAAHWEYDFRDMREPAVETALGLDPEAANLAVIRDGRYKYVHFAALPALFFDLERDPDEFVNEADNPAYRPLVLAYAQKLLSWRLRSEERTLTHLHLGPGGLLERHGRWR